MYASASVRAEIGTVRGGRDERGKALVHVHCTSIYLCIDAAEARELAARIIAAADQADAAPMVAVGS
jgi:hypothetical protein